MLLLLLSCGNYYNSSIESLKLAEKFDVEVNYKKFQKAIDQAFYSQKDN